MQEIYGRAFASTKVIRITYRCNAFCRFCNILPTNKKDPEIKNIKKRLKGIASSGGKRVAFSGGEPTLCKKLPHLIQYAFDCGIKQLELQTNGLLLADENYVKRLKTAGLKEIFFAFHSHIPEIYDKAVGVQGAYYKSVQAVDNLINHGMQVVFNPVVTSFTYKHLPAYINYLKQRFPAVKFLSLSVIQPHGLAWQHKQLIPRLCDIHPYLEKALAVAADNGLYVINPYCGVPFCIGSWYNHLFRCPEFCANYCYIKAGLNPPGDNNKIKTDICQECDLEKYCNGVWKNYVKIYPHPQLKPVSLKNIKQ
jgi:MoaA/NifB/PqqE/SkfB family radical SAM enzyme